MPNFFNGFMLPTLTEFIMIVIGAHIIHMSISRRNRELLLVPLGLSIIFTNIPFPNLSVEILDSFFSFFSIGLETAIFSSLLFFAIGTTIDIGLILADPKLLLIGASSQLGVLFVYFIMTHFNFSPDFALSNAVIGSAEGALTMYTSSFLTDYSLFSPLVVISFAYIVFLPKIQYLFSIVFITKAEKRICMDYLRYVSVSEKIIFSVVVLVLCALFLPNAFIAIGSLLVGSIFRESNIMNTFSENVQNYLMGMLNIFIGFSLGFLTTDINFLNINTLYIAIFGFVSLFLSIFISVLVAKILNIFTGGKVNPLIGISSVGTFPSSSLTIHNIAQNERSQNCLLLHSMAVSISNIIFSIITAGLLLSFLNK